MLKVSKSILGAISSFAIGLSLLGALPVSTVSAELEQTGNAVKCLPRTGPEISEFYTQVPYDNCGEQGVKRFDGFVKRLLMNSNIKEVVLGSKRARIRVFRLSKTETLVVWPVNQSYPDELCILGQLGTTEDALRDTLPMFFSGQYAIQHLRENGVNPKVIASGSYTDGSNRKNSHTYGLQINRVRGKGLVLDGPIPQAAPYGFFSIGFLSETYGSGLVSGFPALEKTSDGKVLVRMKSIRGSSKPITNLHFLFQGGPAIGAGRDGDVKWNPLHRFKISPGLARDGLTPRARVALVVNAKENVVSFLSDSSSTLADFSDLAARYRLHGTMLNSGSKAFLAVYGEDGSEFIAVHGEKNAVNANFLYVK